MRPVIHSTKHYVPFPILPIPTATRNQQILVQAVATPDKNDATEVEEGAVVKAVFVELWLLNSANDGEEIVTICKTQSNDNGPSFAELATLFTYDNKKNILFTHQGLSSNNGVGNPIVTIRNWIKIPKSKQRFGLGDQLVLSIANVSSNDLSRCGIAIYKEYT